MPTVVVQVPALRKLAWIVFPITVRGSVRTMFVVHDCAEAADDRKTTARNVSKRLSLTRKLLIMVVFSLI
jgi:hypothetical protein